MIEFIRGIRIPVSIVAITCSLGALNEPGKFVLAVSYADWQRWQLLSAGAKATCSPPTSYRPIVLSINHAPENNKLGAVYEFAVGNGRLVVCTLGLAANLAGRLVTAQLLNSLSVS